LFWRFFILTLSVLVFVEWFIFKALFEIKKSKQMKDLRWWRLVNDVTHERRLFHQHFASNFTHNQTCVQPPPLRPKMCGRWWSLFRVMLRKSKMESQNNGRSRQVVVYSNLTVHTKYCWSTQYFPKFTSKYSKCHKK
jgi:hypothetical protein